MLGHFSGNMYAMLGANGNSIIFKQISHQIRQWYIAQQMIRVFVFFYKQFYKFNLARNLFWACPKLNILLSLHNNRSTSGKGIY